MPSRIAGPDAFATARPGHPSARAALSTAYDRRQPPAHNAGTIAEPLGSDGHTTSTR